MVIAVNKIRKKTVRVAFLLGSGSIFWRIRSGICIFSQIGIWDQTTMQ